MLKSRPPPRSRHQGHPPRWQVSSLSEGIEQGLGLNQVRRVEVLGKPAKRRHEKIACLLSFCPDRAKTAPCSLLRATRTTLLSAFVRSIARARKTLLLSQCLSRPASARYHRRCDGYQLRTTFPWLFPRRSSLRRCSAMHRRTVRALHRPPPHMTCTRGHKRSRQSTGSQRLPLWPQGLHLKLCRSAQEASLAASVRTTSSTDCLCPPPMRQVHRQAPRLPHGPCEGCASTTHGTVRTLTSQRVQLRGHL